MLLRKWANTKLKQYLLKGYVILIDTFRILNMLQKCWSNTKKLVVNCKQVILY
ncbi:hypothetical protein A4V01_22330 [Erysipelotrichaceae bacterium I46]|nr:hypothetical protein A4V01_22330 [Erysipelotrichaceae bacterium I46]ASU21111.1 hypothetical protein ADH65_19350 [[Clostridium] innocuum]QQR28421.1 hypothetical protein I5Q87_14510 [[Clostridium] innocuum]